MPAQDQGLGTTFVLSNRAKLSSAERFEGCSHEHCTTAVMFTSRVCAGPVEVARDGQNLRGVFSALLQVLAM